MQVQMKELVSSYRALNEICQLDMNAAIGYKFGRAIKKVSEELTLYEEKRSKLMDKYGVKWIETEQKNTYPNEEFETAFKTQLNAILDVTIELPLTLVTQEELASFKCKGDILAFLGWLIETPKEKNSQT